MIEVSTTCVIIILLSALVIVLACLFGYIFDLFDPDKLIGVCVIVIVLSLLFPLLYILIKQS